MRLALTRTLVGIFWLLTAVYALLSAIPFASKQFLEPDLVPELTRFAVSHRWFALAAFGLAVAGLWPWIRARHRGVLLWAGADTLATLAAMLTPGIAALQPSPLALAVVVGALVPPVWLSLIDPRESDARTPHDVPGAVSDFMACAGAALTVALAFAVPSLMAAPRDLAGPGSDVALHLLAFSVFFAALSMIRGLARYTSQPAAVESWLTRTAVAGLLAAFFLRVVLSSLSFTGPKAVGMAAVLAAALAVMVGPRGTAAPRGVGEALSGLFPRWASRSTALTIVWAALAMAGIVAGSMRVSGSDWNFTIVKGFALAAWLIALAAGLRLAGSLQTVKVPERWGASLAPFVACLMILAGYQLAGSGLSARTADGAAPTSGRGPSARLIADALAPAGLVDASLFDYLQQHTNIARSVRVEPVAVDFAALSTRSARRPHIFMFVIDSLRRDYLSPYNDGVSFTPAIGQFARESTVFERVFTRYGATGLSVPSIWVGGMVLHKQYVTPFAPMNTLAKLVAAEGYTPWISTDQIVEAIAPPSVLRDPLDAAVQVKDHRLCQTLSEVRGRLDRLTADAPAFVYALPQDVHVSALTREGSRPIDAGSYGSFNAAYASRVRRLDACFGEFIDDLKTRGLYDDSIVILTADHGDSLGEEGRMGHAYTIFPEILQIPLLVHLPADLRGTYVADPAAVAFTSDLTPSLYALLGHTPAAPAGIFGRPLFAPGAAPRRPDRPEVVASSYGSVYGALLDDARRLYIVDAVSLREYQYALDGSAAGRPMPVREPDREAGQRAIRSAIDGIASFYRFTPPSP